MQTALSAKGVRPNVRGSASLSRPCRLNISCVARPQLKASKPSPAAPASIESTLSSAILASAAGISPFLFQVQSAFAAEGNFGILEGRTAALIHPAVMFFLFGATAYSGYLGYQWRRAREVGDEIRELKKQLPAVAADGARPASPLDAQIAEKDKLRKDLIAGNYRDKHWTWGSILLASGVTIAVEGCVNTWMRTGKLFPGPHLFAGASIVILWALAAALTPAMQKGNDQARSAHIALNAINLALFTWQIPTGLEIVAKVFQFTQWP